MRLEIYNSYCTLTGEIPQNAHQLVERVLTYENDIEAEKSNLFYRLNMTKQTRERLKQILEDKYLKPESRRDFKIKYDKANATYFGIIKSLKDLEATATVCWFKNNSFPTGHVNIVKEALKVAGAQYEVVDHRKVPLNDLFLKWNNVPFDPRYYQTEAIDVCVEAGRGVVESAVGTGKSLMQAYITKQLSVNTLIVVPSSGLSAQIYNDFAAWFGNQHVQIVDTKAVRSGKGLKPIRIITIQSMASLQKSGELQELVHDVNAIFVDEIHHAGSASYTNLLPEIDHIYYRFGFTGTFLRNDSKSLDMWGFLSNVLYRYPAHKAIEEGFLTPIEMKIYELPGKRSVSYHKEYDKNYCGNPFMLQQVYNICANEALGKQVLLLVNKKDKAGKIFFEYLQRAGFNVSYISGDNSKEEITQTIRDFNDKKINILIGSSVIGEGIDVRSADHLIMCQGGKSEIAIVQAVGRLVRLFEGKSVGYLHDFSFINTKFMKKHLLKRVDIVKRNFAPGAINTFNCC